MKDKKEERPIGLMLITAAFVMLFSAMAQSGAVQEQEAVKEAVTETIEVVEIVEIESTDMVEPVSGETFRAVEVTEVVSEIEFIPDNANFGVSQK